MQFHHGHLIGNWVANLIAITTQCAKCKFFVQKFGILPQKFDFKVLSKWNFYNF